MSTSLTRRSCGDHRAETAGGLAPFRRVASPRPLRSLCACFRAGTVADCEKTRPTCPMCCTTSPSPSAPARRLASSAPPGPASRRSPRASSASSRPPRARSNWTGAARVHLVGSAETPRRINIADVGLTDLRSRITIIPQDPVILSGTLRSALDIWGEHSDMELYDALRRVHLLPPEDVPRDPDALGALPFWNLDSTVEAEGSNFSQGQRQLICMARALLRRSKLVRRRLESPGSGGV